MSTHTQTQRCSELYVHGVLLFVGGDPVSKLIRTITSSRYSHVGLWLIDEEGVQYCFESTGSFSDVLLRQQTPCVQLSQLRPVLEAYPGLVRSRRFVNQPKVNVAEFVNCKIGVGYETHLSSLVRALTRSNTSDGSDSYFCSELVAAALHAAQCLSTNSRNADNYLPRDFASASQDLLLCSGVTLKRERTLKKPRRYSCCSAPF